MEKLKGFVVWFDRKKGIGFLRGDGQTKDHFVHYTNIKADGFKTLEAGQKVQYGLGSNHRGEQAVDVEVVVEE